MEQKAVRLSCLLVLLLDTVSYMVLGRSNLRLQLHLVSHTHPIGYVVGVLWMAVFEFYLVMTFALAGQGWFPCRSDFVLCWE